MTAHVQHITTVNRRCQSLTTRDFEGTLIDCKAGCSTIDVLNALGLEFKDLYDEAGSTPPAPAQKKKATRHATHEKAIAAVRWSVEQNGSSVAETIPYLYENGQPFGYNVRFNFAEGGKTFRQIHRDGDAWLSKSGPNLWPLYLLNDIPADGTIYIHEGEKACDSGVTCGLPSTACKGGCEAPDKTDWSPLAGRDVVILPDNDSAGEKFVTKVTPKYFTNWKRRHVVKLRDASMLDQTRRWWRFCRPSTTSAKTPETVKDAMFTAALLEDLFSNT